MKHTIIICVICLPIVQPLTLSYKPIKPFYFSGRPYPEPIIPPGPPLPDRAKEDVNVQTSTQQAIQPTSPDKLPEIQTVAKPSAGMQTTSPNLISSSPNTPTIPFDESIIDTVTRTTIDFPDRSKTDATTPGISLEYVPTRPTFYPNDKPYPMPGVPSGNQPTSIPQDEILVDAVTKTTQRNEFTDRFKEPEMQSSTELNHGSMVPIVPPEFTTPDQLLVTDDRDIIDLFRPSRPNEITDSTLNSEAQFSTGTVLITNPTQGPLKMTTKPNQIVNLGYVPMLPFYASGKPYPQPIIRPETSQATGISSTNKPFTSKTPVTTPVLLEIDIRHKTTTVPSAPNQPSLEYQPMLPTFISNPKPYPQPFIPRETPWPASSTQMPVISSQTLPSRFGEDSSTRPLEGLSNISDFDLIIFPED